MLALVITGPPGAGESSVLEALSDALVDDDVCIATGVRGSCLPRGAATVDGSLSRRDTALMATGNAELVRSGFDAFLRGDWHALSEAMDPAVEWLWYEPRDCDCHDRRKVLETLFERQREGVVTDRTGVHGRDGP